MSSSESISQSVKGLYNTYPFPPEPLLDEPPPGYNWRWKWSAAYAFCTGQKPSKQAVRVLDAGCGTGVSTEYIAHLNPQAQVVGIDLSDRACVTAIDRCNRSGATNVTFHNLSLYEVASLERQFDWINCVGVLHHLPDPIKGLQSLGSVLAPGGIFHIFVYAALGRWEITLTQKAIALLQGNRRGDYKDGVSIGRKLFATLPKQNRLRRREEERWSLENQRDANFADMYVHPQEIDYTIDSLFDLIDASGLDFLGFSNPRHWSLDRLIGTNSDLMARARSLSERDRFRLIELLDPEITHFEFFLGKPPLTLANWSDDDRLQSAHPERHPCMQGWPSLSVFDYDYQIVELTEAEFAFLEKCDATGSEATVADCLEETGLDLDGVRSLQQRQLILLSP